MRYDESYISKFKIFQTTVGRVLCEQELVKFGKEQMFYICFSKNSSGLGLKHWVGEKDRVTFLNRSEACERFNVEDGDDKT